MELRSLIAYFFIINKSLKLNYHGSKFYWWKKLEYPEKTTELLQVTDKHNVVSRTTLQVGNQTHNLSGERHVKFNYYTITAMTSPPGLELRLWCLTPLSTIFQLYHGRVPSRKLKKMNKYIYCITGNFGGFGLKTRHLIIADFFSCGMNISAPKKKEGCITGSNN